jgi:hypothetical protein
LEIPLLGRRVSRIEAIVQRADDGGDESTRGLRSSLIVQLSDARSIR